MLSHNKPVWNWWCLRGEVGRFPKQSPASSQGSQARYRDVLHQSLTVLKFLLCSKPSKATSTLRVLAPTAP